MYTIVDVLDKLIEVEKRGYVFYTSILQEGMVSQPVKTMVGVLAREEQRHMKIYSDIKEALENKDALDIDFDAYDKIYKVFKGFEEIPSMETFHSTGDLLQYAIDFENKNLALVITIQGILARDASMAERIPYDVLTKVIGEERSHIENLEKFLK